MQLHVDLINTYEAEFGHFNLSSGAHVSVAQQLIIHIINSFIDIENRTSYLNGNSFIEFLEVMRQSIPERSRMSDSTFGPMFIPSCPSVRNMLFHDYAFSILFDRLSPANAFLPLTDTYFAYYRILTDDEGRFRIRFSDSFDSIGTYALLSYSATGDGELSWEFTRHFMHAVAYPVGLAQLHPPWNVAPTNAGNNNLATPIERALFESQITRSMKNAVEVIGTQYRHRHIFRLPFPDYINTPGGQARVAEYALQRLAVYNEMPVVHPPFFPAGVVDGLTGILDNFLLGITTPQAAAQQMHNMVSLWLIE